MAVELPELIVPDAAAWRRWLGRRHDREPGVWLVLAKKGTEEPTRLAYDEALEEALCHGWIDGMVRRRDEHTYRQRFTPRRPRSALVEPQRRHRRAPHRGRPDVPGGEAAIASARADGRWEAAYAGPATIEVPDDLAAALARRPDARAAFEQLTSQNRYAILYRVAGAKRPDTRAKRIEQFVAMLREGRHRVPAEAPGPYAARAAVEGIRATPPLRA